jgi:hypothetical protein
MRTRTSPGPGIGSGRLPTSRTSRAAPFFSYHAALIVVAFPSGVEDDETVATVTLCRVESPVAAVQQLRSLLPVGRGEGAADADACEDRLAVYLEGFAKGCDQPLRNSCEGRCIGRIWNENGEFVAAGP